MRLQSLVVKHHRLKRGNNEALHQAVTNILSQATDTEVFVKVFDKLAKNYTFIRACGGDNNLVEEFWDKSGALALTSYLASQPATAKIVAVDGDNRVADGKEDLGEASEDKKMG